MIEFIRIIRKEIKVIVNLLSQNQKELNSVKKGMPIDLISRWIAKRMKDNSVLHVVNTSLEK